mgnify:CR=1 FL=1
MVKQQDKGYRIEQDATVLEEKGFRYHDVIYGSLGSSITGRQIESMYVSPEKFEEVAVIEHHPQGRSRGMDVVKIYVKGGE